MIARTITLAACFGLLATSAGAQAAAPPAPDTAASRVEVMAVVTQLFDHMRKQDTASMRALFHSSAMLLSSGVRNGSPTVSASPITGWLSSIAQAPDTVVLDERLMDTVVHVQDGLASVWTAYEFWVGKRFSHCGVDAIVLGKTADGWKLLTVADTRRRTDCSQTPAR